MLNSVLTMYCSGEGRQVLIAELDVDASGNFVHNGHYLNGASAGTGAGPISPLSTINMLELARLLVREYGIGDDE